MPAESRKTLSDTWAGVVSSGNVLVSTCHRVELYGTRATVDDAALRGHEGVRVVCGSDAVRHLVSLAVGRESTVLGEDQVLHQLRLAIHDARRHGVAPGLDRAFDLALRAGRVARSWLPANRPSLADLALDILTDAAELQGADVHVVGSGEMGRRTLTALMQRGARPTVSSRSAENSRALAARHAVTALVFDPGAERLRSVVAVVVALAGRWPLSDSSREALLESRAWVIDLSSPPALEPELAAGLGARLLSIDDVSVPAGQTPSVRTVARFDALIDQVVAAYEEWAADGDQRDAADALARRAREAQSAELNRLWRRVPTLDETQRAEVARAVEHLTERLLRDPLEQLNRDRDGSQARAVRELFRL